MRSKIAALLATFVLSAAAAHASTAAPTDLEQLAERLVRGAAVIEGDIVMISGQVHDAELLENIAVNVRKNGGFALVVYDSDRLSKRMFFDVPAKYDSQPNELGAKLAGIVDVTITVTDALTEDLFAGADPQRMAARGKVSEAVANEFQRHKVRSIEVGNGFYPTGWRAARYGMSEAELSNMFWNGVNTDYASLQTRAAQVKAALAAGNLLHIRNPNGTDLKVRVQGRPVLVSDGVITADDLKTGGGALAVYLPAGEVYVTPVPGTAEGTVVHTRDFFRGKQIDNLTLKFKAGRLTSMTGSGPGYADFRAAYDAVSDERKNLFGFVDLGINPSVKLPANSKVGNWVPAGTVTVGMAGNVWAGGDNSVPYGVTVFLPGSTVTLDGKPIIKGGQLKL